MPKLKLKKDIMDEEGDINCQVKPQMLIYHHYENPDSYYSKLETIFQYSNNCIISNDPCKLNADQQKFSTNYEDIKIAPTTDPYANEISLLEELEIDPQQIFHNILFIVNPVAELNQDILNKFDLAGPLVLWLLLGMIMLLSGKMMFSHLYNISAVGALAFYCLLSLMSTKSCVTLSLVISFLGYNIFPLLILCFLNLLFTFNKILFLIIAISAVVWSSYKASLCFVIFFTMPDQQWIVAYPCLIFYIAYSLIIIF